MDFKIVGHLIVEDCTVVIGEDYVSSVDPARVPSVGSSGYSAVFDAAAFNITGVVIADNCIIYPCTIAKICTTSDEGVCSLFDGARQ